MSIVRKLIVALSLVVLILCAAGGYCVHAAQRELEASAEARARRFAVKTMGELDDLIEQRVSDWQLFGADPAVLSQLRASNVEWSALDDAPAEMERRDAIWRAAADDPRNAKLRRDVVAAELSDLVRRRLSLLARRGDEGLYGEVFLTNRFGATVAASGPTSDFRQDDEDWWQQAHEKGVHLTDFHPDHSARMESCAICLRLDDEGEFVGILKAVMRASAIEEVIARGMHVPGGGRVEVALLGVDGRILYRTDERLHPELCSSTPAGELGRGDDGLIVSRVPARTARDIGFAAGLVSAVHSDEVFASVSGLVRELLVILLAVGTISLLLGALFLLPLSRGLRRLTDSLRRIGGGEEGVRVPVSGRDELSTLARAFNELATDLDRARVAAGAAERARNDFLGNMSHELRTPIGAILGSLRELRTPGVSSPAALEDLELGASRLVELVDDFFAVCEIENGSVEVRPQPCELAAVVHGAMDRVRGAAEEKGLELRAQLGAPIPAMVWTDPVRLRQILHHLLSNAVRFTEEGEVRVELRVLEDGEDWRVQLDVVDSGPGLSREQRRTVCELFSQVDPSTTRRHEGAGLGLAVVSGLSKALGGTLEIDSEPGRGSRFRLDLPAARHASPGGDDREGGLDSAVSDRARELAGLSVLIVEDNPINQRILGRIVARLGARSRLATDGAEAVEMLLDDALPCDVVLMDLMMPVMDGFEATSRLRQAGLELPVIAVTADSRTVTRERCLKGGFDGFVSKPIDEGGLRESIRQALASVDEAARSSGPSLSAPTVS